MAQRAAPCPVTRGDGAANRNRVLSGQSSLNENMRAMEIRKPFGNGIFQTRSLHLAKYWATTRGLRNGSSNIFHWRCQIDAALPFVMVFAQPVQSNQPVHPVRKYPTFRTRRIPKKSTVPAIFCFMIPPGTIQLIIGDSVACLPILYIVYGNTVRTCLPSSFAAKRRKQAERGASGES